MSSPRVQPAPGEEQAVQPAAEGAEEFFFLVEYKNTPQSFLNLRQYLLDANRQMHKSLRAVDRNYREVVNYITSEMNLCIIAVEKSNFKEKGSQGRFELIKAADDHLQNVKMGLDNLFLSGIIPKSKRPVFARKMASTGKGMRRWLMENTTKPSKRVSA